MNELLLTDVLPLGIAKCGVFETLNISARNCNPNRSVIRNWRIRLKSALTNPGPDRPSVPQVPNVPAASQPLFAIDAQNLGVQATGASFTVT